MAEKVFNLRNMVDAVNVDSFYKQVGSELGMTNGEVGYDAGKGKFPVKLCLVDYSTLKITWDERQFPELENRLGTVLSGLIQRQPSEIAASAVPILAIHSVS